MSRLESVVSVACRALVLIEGGLSERGAIRRASREKSDVGARREAFTLVMNTLEQKSLIDRVIESETGKVPTNKEKLSVSRLAVVLLLLAGGVGKRDSLVALLKSSPSGFHAETEKLVGSIALRNTINDYLIETSESIRTGLELGYREWWVDYCIRVWGRAEALRMLSNKVRTRYLHLNPLRPDVSSVNELPGLEPVSSIPGFFRVLTQGLSAQVREYVEMGRLEGQDLASYLAVVAGDPTEHDTVLDVCTAPGAKTGALSQLMHNGGAIVSVDYSQARMRDWKRMVNMLGVQNASGLVEDATRPAFKEESAFDLVLVDPPCSGSGIFSRNPEMKWHLSPTRLSRYSELQCSLLRESSKFLKSDGRIIYSTCSISLEENEEIISRFLRDNPDFETRPILDGLGHPGLRGYENCKRFYPHLDGTSGYFIARLERVA